MAAIKQQVELDALLKGLVASGQISQYSSHLQGAAGSGAAGSGVGEEPAPSRLEAALGACRQALQVCYCCTSSGCLSVLLGTG